MKIINFYLFILLLVTQQGSSQSNNITIRLSYKVVINNDGNRPEGITDDCINNKIDVNTGSCPLGFGPGGVGSDPKGMNQLMEKTWRGFRFEKLHSPLEIGNTGREINPSKWFNKNLLGENLVPSFIEELLNNKTIYAWKENAINIYIIGSSNNTSGNEKGFYSKEANVIVLHGIGNSGTHLHEIGHFLNLYHTWGRGCNKCGDNCVDQNILLSDGVNDTLDDHVCRTSKNKLSIPNFGKPFNELNTEEKKIFNLTFYNIMSYRNQLELTEGQLDRITDFIMVSARDVIDKDVLFLSDRIFLPFLGLEGSSFYPYTSVSQVVNNIKPGGVIIAKPGEYKENITIDKPLTIRATRAGKVIIGN